MSETDLPEVLFRARLQRPERNTPWGFRLQGGVEFNKPLTLLKVIPESVAAKVGLNAGDILVRLAGRSAVSMTHREAQQAIVNSGNTLEIIVERADVTCPSLSVKGQLEVNDLNLESSSVVEKQNDRKNSGMLIDEDGFESTAMTNSEKIVGSADVVGSVDSIEKSITSQTEPEGLPHPNTSTTSTTSSTPSVIPTNATPTTNHYHHQTPLVNDGTVPSRAVQPAPKGCLRDGKQDSWSDPELNPDCGAEESNGRDEQNIVEADMMMTTTITITDHNDNIPLAQAELKDSLPVRALIKTNALTSELGDDSTEVADDQSSEFSDDISVIEMQTEVNDPTGNPDEEEDDGVVPVTGSIVYQDETEYREISLLGYDRRFPETETTTRSAESTSVPETEMNRMRASLYLSSLESKGEDVQSPMTTAEMSAGTSSSIDKSSRDFSQTAPWRLSSKGGGSGTRRTDDPIEGVTGRSPPVKRREPDALSKMSTFTISDQNQQRLDYPITDNVIYIPISIFDKQLKMGSDNSFQLKSSSSSGVQTPEKSSPMSLTLMGRRTEERFASNQETLAQTPVALTTAGAPVTMTTARVYIAPMTSQSTARSVHPVSPETEVVPAHAQSSAIEPRRLPSSEVVPSELLDIPLPAVKDIVADLNSRLVRVAETYETSGTGNQSVVVPTTRLEVGTNFGRRDRRRSSSGSDNEKDIIVSSTPFDPGSEILLLGDQLVLPRQPSSTYCSVVYRPDLSPKPSIRRYSLPGGSVSVKDSVQRRVRFAEPPESSVIEIEGRQRRWPASERVRLVSSVPSPEADYVSVSCLAEKLDRIELENALASAAMKRSRPFQVSNLLASHPGQHTADIIRASSPMRGSTTSSRAVRKLDPIQERVINIQTIQPSDLRPDEQQFRMGSQRGGGVAPIGTVQCSDDFGGVFSLSIGPGSGGHLNLSLQQHPNQGSRQGHSPTKVNLVLPTAGDVGGKSERFSYSVSTAGGREPIRYALPPSYEESVLAMAAGRHPRSSSLDDPRPGSGPPVMPYPSRVSELRADSQLISGSFPQQPGVRVVRAQSPIGVPGASHPGWVISTSPAGQGQDSNPRKAPGYSQTLQVDSGSKPVDRAASWSLGLPVFHARSGALASDLAGYQAAMEGPQATDPFSRIVVQPSGSGKQRTSGGDQLRPDVAARLGRSWSPLVLSPGAISGSGSIRSMQGASRSFSPLSSPPGSDQRWLPPQPQRLLHDHHGPPRPGRPTVAAIGRSPTTTTAQQPTFVRQSIRQAAPASMARTFSDARGLPTALQRMPGIFALLDKTFTDKVMQWEGPSRSDGLQQSETYKLVREMDDAMKHDTL